MNGASTLSVRHRIYGTGYLELFGNVRQEGLLPQARPRLCAKRHVPSVVTHHSFDSDPTGTAFVRPGQAVPDPDNPEKWTGHTGPGRVPPDAGPVPLFTCDRGERPLGSGDEAGYLKAMRTNLPEEEG